MSNRLANAIAELAALQADQVRQLKRLRAELVPVARRPKSPKKKPRVRVTRPSVATLGTPSELDRAWARKLLRRKGLL